MLIILILVVLLMVRKFIHFNEISVNYEMSVADVRGYFANQLFKWAGLSNATLTSPLIDIYGIYSIYVMINSQKVIKILKYHSSTRFLMMEFLFI